MSSTVDRLREMRGTRTARAIAVAIALGVGASDPAFDSGTVGGLAVGLLTTAVGLLGAYGLVAGESVVESVGSWR